MLGGANTMMVQEGTDSDGDGDVGGVLSLVVCEGDKIIDFLKG